MMQNGNPNTTLPPDKSTNYEYDMMQYNKKYVVPEDLEEVNANMSIKNVVEKLKNRNTYEFTAGFFDEKKEYHRSRIQFNYYDKACGLIVVTRTDITKIYMDEGEKERKLARALREAQHDAMTDLYNSKAASELIKDTLLHQYRAKAVVLFIDLDNFKQVNDTLGHIVGDEVLCHVAQVLKKIASKDGIAGRIGGDEFVLFMPVSSTMENVAYYADSICNSLQDCQVLSHQNVLTSCSVGVSVYPEDGTTYKELLLKADQALYDAKGNGKKCYSFYNTSMLTNKKGSQTH